MHTSVSWLLSLNKVDRRAELKDYSLSTLDDIHMLVKSEIEFAVVDWTKVLFSYIFSCLFLTPLVFLINALGESIVLWHVYVMNAVLCLIDVGLQVRAYRKLLDLSLDVGAACTEKKADGSEVHTTRFL